MKVERKAVIPDGVQIAELLDVKPENVQITRDKDSIEVLLGEVREGRFVVTGDVPSRKESIIKAWAEKQLR